MYTYLKYINICMYIYLKKEREFLKLSRKYFIGNYSNIVFFIWLLWLGVYL